jgi:transcriptional antiterminator/mannitol/fructose-specific phosphotransferase system IIA component (Ntr-type)
MNNRVISIIYELCKIDREVSIKGLAGKYEVSQRTIRNDLNKINELLQENKLQELSLKSGGQVCRADDFENVLLFLSNRDFYTYKLSKEERVKISASMLVNSSKYITLFTIAEHLFVSRTTIINDLVAIKNFIKQSGLQLLSHPNKGLRVEGAESSKRMFLIKLAELKQGDMKQDVVSKYISIQAGNKIVLQKILNEQEHIHASYLTDDSFHYILRYLGIMVSRNMQGEFIEVRPKNRSGKYRMAQDILKYIVQYCHISTTEDEVEFLNELLMKVRYFKHKSSETDVLKIQIITRQFIEHISEEIGNNLNDDYDFFENLSNHLASILSETTASYPDNLMIDEILEEHQAVLTAVEKRQSIIQNSAGHKLSKKDLEYVAIHVCAALERKKNKEIAFHVIVACHAGIGTSQLLLEKLKTHFNFQIVDVISSHEVKNINVQKADFIITTVPLEHCRLDYVIVSPLLNDEDYIRVGNKIDALRNSRHLPARIENNEVTAKGMIERLTPLIEEMVPREAALLMKRLRRVVREYFQQSVEAEAEIFSPYLHHLLPPASITLDVVCRDWREAVKKSGEKLLEQGYIESRYIDAMIHNIEENGPYVVLSPGFAVPHEGLEAGSIKVGMHLIRLKQPVPFGSEEFDPVEFVCCLSAVDRKTHLKAFFNLVNMLQTENFKSQLHTCTSADEAARIIEAYEYQILK